MLLVNGVIVKKGQFYESYLLNINTGMKSTTRTAFGNSVLYISLLGHINDTYRFQFWLSATPNFTKMQLTTLVEEHSSSYITQKYRKKKFNEVTLSKPTILSF
jgi:hypothetical protein